MRFTVECTVTYNGTVEVDAENREQAMAEAWEMLHQSDKPRSLPDEGNVGEVNFFFGDASVDYIHEEIC